jgi:hypothetical protein
MRTIWLAVILAAVGAAEVHAQDSMMQKLTYHPTPGGDDMWAAHYAGGQPEPAPAPLPPPGPAAGPSLVAPPPDAPHPGPGYPAGGCATCGGGCPRPGCATCAPKGAEHGWCECLGAWLGYKSRHCWCKLEHCCHEPQVYLFYVHECAPGAGHVYPPCECGKGGPPCFLAPGHAFFGLPSNHGCCCTP